MSKDKDITNSYFILYKIFLVALKSPNIEDGISKILYFIKIFFEASDVVLYKINDNGDYIHQFNQSLMNHSSDTITETLNTTKNVIERKKIYHINLNYNNLQCITFFPIILKNTKYIIAISNIQKLEDFDESFIDLFIDTMHIILDKLELINRLSKTAKVDSLTGLSNRSSYEKRINNNEINDNIVYGILDLFRLKNINDNYSHALGDDYIVKTAEILKKYFPKYIYTKDSNGKTSKVETGSCLYRIGGDEFVLISNSETYEKAMLKMAIITDEIKNLDLGINEHIGINYGIVQGKNGTTFRDLYLKADQLLSENKRQAYLTLKLN